MRCRVPIDEYAFIDLDAPTLAAEPLKSRGRVYWRVWCKHCEVFHLHGAGEGHREAHCRRADSPYRRSGYNLARKG